MRQAALLKLKRHAEEQIAVAEAKVRGQCIPYSIIINIIIIVDY
jgi:hypothetical protein